MSYKAQVKVSPTTVVEVSGADIKEVFRRRAEAEEVLAEEKCGVCESPRIRYVVRKVSKGKNNYEYFEVHCRACGARLAFGQSQDTTSLFPKRRLNDRGEPDMENGTFGKHGGWTKFRGDKE